MLDLALLGTHVLVGLVVIRECDLFGFPVKIADVGGAWDCAGDRGLALLGVSALYQTFGLLLRQSVRVDDIQRFFF